MSITFDPANHEYTLNGKSVPSVTKILEVSGMYPRYPEGMREFALARGAACHRVLELYDLGDLGRIDERLEGYLCGWKLFLRDTGFEPVLIEQRVASEQYLFAGTLDRWGRLGSKKALVDIKSGEPSSATAIQTAAYKRALVETLGDEYHADVRLGVQVSPSGTYQVTAYENHAEDDRIFLMSLSLFRWKEKNL